MWLLFLCYQNNAVVTRRELPVIGIQPCADSELFVFWHHSDLNVNS